MEWFDEDSVRELEKDWKQMLKDKDPAVTNWTGWLDSYSQGGKVIENQNGLANRLVARSKLSMDWEETYHISIQELSVEHPMFTATNDFMSAMTGYSGCITTKQEDENAQIVWDYMKGKGWTDYAIAGLLGNFMRESSMDPTCIEVGNNNEGHGLAQWSYGRRVAFLEAVPNWDDVGDDESRKAAIEAQCQYIIDEPYDLSAYHVEKYATKRFSSIAEATYEWMAGWERPPQSELDLYTTVRLPAAIKYYYMFSGDQGYKIDFDNLGEYNGVIPGLDFEGRAGYCVNPIVYFCQSKGEFANCLVDPYVKEYSGRTMCSSGCGFCSLAMAISYTRSGTSKSGWVTPKQVVETFARSNNGDNPYYNGNGCETAAYTAGVELFGVHGRKLENSITAVVGAIKRGHAVIMSSKASPKYGEIFTGKTHIIVLTGITQDGKILVNNPNTKNQRFPNQAYYGVEPAVVMDSVNNGFWEIYK